MKKPEFKIFLLFLYSYRILVMMLCYLFELLRNALTVKSKVITFHSYCCWSIRYPYHFSLLSPLGYEDCYPFTYLLLSALQASLISSSEKWLF
jgi:hypothetical protein